MPTFTFTSSDGKNYSVEGPEGATQEQAFQILQSQLGTQNAPPAQPDAGPKGFIANAADFVKSIPRGVMENIASTPAYLPESPAPPPDSLMVSTADKMAAADKDLGLHQPEGRAGKFGQAVGSSLGNPLSYVGPGSMALKVGGSVLSALGSEGAGQAAEGTPYEGPARIAGALAGGAAAVKALGPKAPEAIVPTYPELKDSYKQGYKDAIQSGVELKPDALGQFSEYATNHISTHPELSFTQRSAPETFAVLNYMRNPPAVKDGVSNIITAANINQIKRDLNTIAGQTQPGQTPGVFKSTPDAVAAMAVRDKFNQYLENLPQDHIVAGDPEAYRMALQQANGDFGAAERLKAAQGRIDTAQENAAGQIAGSVDQQLRGQMRGLLKSSASRSYSPDERAAVQSVNRGNFGSNVLTQLGRGGAGVVPLAAQAAVGIPTAIATGGASIAPQMAIAAALYGARKGGEILTGNRAKNLVEMLAKRSPLYESRVNELPPPDVMSGKAAILRALLAR